jgi:hypothetical protein
LLGVLVWYVIIYPLDTNWTTQFLSQLSHVYGWLRTFQCCTEHQAATANAGKKHTRQGKAHIPCFVGMLANTNYGCPPEKKGRLYQACVREAWAVETRNTALLMSGDPKSYTLFKLKISKDDLDKEDCMYLGGDKDKESELDKGLAA